MFISLFDKSLCFVSLKLKKAINRTVNIVPYNIAMNFSGDYNILCIMLKSEVSKFNVCGLLTSVDQKFCRRKVCGFP